MLNDEVFIALVEAIEAEGGELIPETHVGTPVFYETTDPNGRTIKREKKTAGCGAETVVHIPYGMEDVESTDGNTAVGAKGMMRACLICDGVHRWPRYAHVVAG